MSEQSYSGKYANVYFSTKQFGLAKGQEILKHVTNYLETTPSSVNIHPPSYFAAVSFNNYPLPVSFLYCL
jgi:hypothetical protein